MKFLKEFIVTLAVVVTLSALGAIFGPWDWHRFAGNVLKPQVFFPQLQDRPILHFIWNDHPFIMIPIWAIVLGFIIGMFGVYVPLDPNRNIDPKELRTNRPIRFFLQELAIRTVFVLYVGAVVVAAYLLLGAGMGWFPY